MYAMPGASVLPYRSIMPTFGDNCFVAAGAHVIGDVVAGPLTTFWFNSVVRGDVQVIRIGARTNIQDNVTVHVTTKVGPTHIGDDVTIGHNAVLHACTIENLCLIGMGAVVLDNAIIREGSFVAAGALVTPGKEFPPGSMIMGSPAKAVRPLNAEERAFLQISSDRYVALAKEYMR